MRSWSNDYVVRRPSRRTRGNARKIGSSGFTRSGGRYARSASRATCDMLFAPDPMSGQCAHTQGVRSGFSEVAARLPHTGDFAGFPWVADGQLFSIESLEASNGSVTGAGG